MYKRNLVSIIVPTHNRADMLGRALESIKEQTYADWEAIIVANNCHDNTDNVVKEYLQDKRFKFIDVPQPIGAQKARNMGIQRARGEYIAFLDDDDEWLPDKAKKQIEFLKNNIEVSALSCWYTVEKCGKAQKVKGPPEILFDDLLWDNYFGSFSFCMVRHNVFEEIGLLDETLPSCQDWDFWLKVKQKYKTGVISEYLVLYHRHYQYRISSFAKSKLIGHERIYSKYQDYMSEECKKHHYKYIYYFKSLSSSSKKDRFKYFVKMCRLLLKNDIVLFVDCFSHIVFTEKWINIMKKYFMSKFMFRTFRIETMNLIRKSSGEMLNQG